MHAFQAQIDNAPLQNATQHLITPKPFSLWGQVKWFSAQEYNSPTTFPCLLSYKSAALMSHKLCDRREFALRDTTLCAMKGELLHFSKGVPAATSQKYYPAEHFPRSARFPINPMAGSQVTVSSFQLKTTETVCWVQVDKEENRISGLHCKPSSVTWGKSWWDRGIIHSGANLLAIGPLTQRSPELPEVTSQIQNLLPFPP